jgi:hypothetical protein
LSKIHNKIYYELKEKHEKIFQEEVLSKFKNKTLKDQNIKNKLLEIKETINKEYSKKQSINRNFIALNEEVYSKNDKEKFGLAYMDSRGFHRDLENEKYNFWNCEEHANFVENILNELKINNLRVNATPDHGFNLFQIEDKVFFYDLAYGELIGEFTPEFFYQHCFLFGIRDFFSLDINTNMTPRMRDIIKSFNEFQKTEKFEEIVFPRVKNYIEKIRYLLDVNHIDRNFENSFFFSHKFQHQIQHHHKKIDVNILNELVWKFQTIHNKRSKIQKENDIFQLKLTDISESFEWLYKS